MKQKVVNQELKKNFILYKGHTGWKVKTRIFGSLVVTLSALTLAEGLGTTTVHAATDPAAGQITKPVEQQKQSAPTSGNSTPQAPAAVKSNVDSAAGAGGPATSGDDSTGSGNGQSSNGTQLQQNVVVESESLTGDAAAANQTAAGTTNDATSDPKYPVLSQDKATNIGVDTSEVSLTASQIADHFTATVENRDGNDKDYDAKDNTKTAKIHPDGSVALTSNDPHQVYDASGNASSVTGHQAAHVSFEHEVDFSHNFSLSGALGIGSKSSGADSVGFIFAPVDPAEATNGGSGGQLGLQGLANAFGLVYDQYNNTGANDANHNRFNDPEDGSFQPYIGWRTTDAGGILQAAARSDWKAASEAGLNDRETNPLNDFTMDYNATTHVLTATLGTAQFTRTITDTTQGYSISVSASTGGAWNDYSARIDKFTYTPKTIPLTVHLVDSADSDAPLNNADVTAIANIGDTVSVFSTQDAAARAVAKGLVDPSLVSVLPGDSAGNIYVIDGSQTPSSNGKSKTIDGSGVSDDTYYAYTVTDAAKQSVTVPVRLAFTANVTPVDAATGKKIDGLDPVTVVAVAGEPTLVQIPGYTPTTVTLDAPTNGEKIANDVLPIDQGATNPSSTTTKDKATPVSHYYTGTGTTVDGTTVTTKATVGTGQSISTDLNKQPLVDANGDPIVSGGKAIGSNDYYWSTTSNAGATDSTDETKPQTSGSLLLPTGTTLDYWESQAAANQTLADTYNTQAQTMYQEFMKITGLTPAQQEDAQKLLQGVSGIYSSVSASNKTAKDDFEAAKTATVATDIYQDGQNGYAYLKKVQNLLASFKLDLTNLGTKQTDAESSLATFKSWSENYGAEIKLPSADFVSFGPDFWTNGAETTADFNNPAYYEYYSTNTADGAPVTPKNVGNYFFKLTNAGRKYLINLNPNNDKIGLYVSAMLTINPVGAVATVKDATVEYGGGSATDGTVGTWPTFTGSLGSANADHTIDQSDFEVVDDDNNDAVVKYITQLKVNGHYTIRYTQAAQDDLAKDKNYTFTSFGTAKLTVNPRPITVTAQNHGKTYSVPAATDPTLDLTSDSANGLVNGDSIDSLGVKLHRADGEHAGIYAITKDTANSTLNSNYAITVNQGVFTIAQAPVKVQASDLSKTYGDADKTLTLFDATLDDGYQLTDKDVTLTRVAGENVGDYQITGSAVSTSNYNVTVTPGTFTIKKRAVMVQIENQSKTYDDDVSTDPALSWKVVSEQGLAPNETSDVLNVKLNQQAGETIGHHAITGTFDNANYDVHFIDGNLLINPRVVGLIVDPQGKTYGDDDADHPLTCHLADGSTLAADQKLADLVTLTRDTGEDVGDYAITVTPKSNNYTFEVTQGTFTIKKRAVTVQIESQSKTYDDDVSTDPALSWKVVSEQGLAPNETSDVLNVKLNQQAGETIGHHAITGTFDNANYDVHFIDGNLLINPRVVKLIVDPQGKTYGDDDADHPLTCRLTDGSTLAADQKLTDLVTLTRDTGEDVGDYAITVTPKSNNYTFEVTQGTFTIKKRAVTVQIENQSKTYDDDVSTDPALGWKVVSEQGLAPNETSDVLNVKLNQQAGETIGHHAITGTFDNANYDVHFIDGNLLINPRVVGLIVDPQGKTYGDDDADHPLTCRLADGSTLAAGQKLTDLVTLTRDIGENVGDYAITVTPKSNNYTFEVTQGTFTINQRSLTVQTDNQQKVYGEKDPQLTWQVSESTPLLKGDSLADLQVALQRQSGENTGRYTISGEGTAKNYAITVVDGTLAIDPRPVAVTIDKQTKVYGNIAPELTWHVSEQTPLATSQQPADLQLSLSCGTARDVGAYTISGTAANTNFLVTVTNGTLEVTKRPVTVSVTNQTKTYGDADKPFTLKDGQSVVVNGDSEAALGVTLTRRSGENVDTYAITGSSASQNYEVTVTPGTLDIIKRKVTVTADTQLKTYGEDDPTLTLTKDSDDVLVNHDSEKALGVTLTRVAGENAGTYKISGTADSQNYDVTVDPGTFKIAPKVVTVTAADKSKTFGEADPTLTLVDPSAQLVNGDSEAALGVKLTRQAGDTVGEYEITGTATNRNYTTNVLSGTLTIKPAAAQVKVDDSNIVYGNMPAFMGRFSFLRMAYSFAPEDLMIINSQKQVVALADLQAGNYTLQLTKQAQKNLAAQHPNHDFTKFSLGQLSVAKRPVTVQVANQEMYAGHQNPENQTKLVDGSLVDDASKLGLQYEEPNSKEVGTYTIGVKADNPNYAVTVIPGELKVLGKDVDSAGNVTITEKDPAGNVVKVVKQWHDGSQTTFTYDPVTKDRAVHEQKDGKPVDQQKIAPDSAPVTLPDDGHTVTVVSLDPTTKEPEFDHKTTDQTTDASGNVTTTTKNATGDVVKVVKQWTDGSKTIYTADPATGKQTVTEQKDGKTVAQQTIAPDSAPATLPSGDNSKTTVTPGKPGAQPTIDHYTTTKDVDKSGNVTHTTKDAEGNVVKVTKDWHDGGKTIYTYDPKTGKQTVTEQKDGKTVAQQTIAPDSAPATLPSGDNSKTTVTPGKPGTQPTIDHYTTTKDADKSGNVTTTVKDAQGNVVKVTKDWHDGGKTIYTYDPKTGDQTVTEQKDGKTVAHQAIAPDSAPVTLPSGDNIETTVTPGKPGGQPTIEHYTTTKVVDKSGNATATTKDSAGHVVKIDKQWPDGSGIVYTANPTTGKQTISIQKNGQTIAQQTIKPDSIATTLPDGASGEIIVKYDQAANMPTFDHYTTTKTTDASGNVTATTKNATGKVVKITKQWTDGSTTTYTDDPTTGDRTITESRNGKTVKHLTIAPGITEVTLPDGTGGKTIVKFSQSAAMPTFSHYPAVSYTAPAVPTSDAGKTVKITKQWQDGSKVIYTYNPVTGKRLLRELKNGHLIEQRTVAPGLLLAILPDGKNASIIVKFDASGTHPVFTRQLAGASGRRHLTPRKKAVKSAGTRKGEDLHERMTAPKLTLRGANGSRHVQSPAGRTRKLAGTERVRTLQQAVTKQQAVQRQTSQQQASQQQAELPQTGQKNESFLVRLGAVLLALLVTPFVRRRSHESR